MLRLPTRISTDATPFIAKAKAFMCGTTAMTECAICLEKMRPTVLFDVVVDCGHTFHSSCHIRHMSSSPLAACPMCRRSYSLGVVRACRHSKGKWTLATLCDDFANRFTLTDITSHFLFKIDPLPLTNRRVATGHPSRRSPALPRVPSPRAELDRITRRVQTLEKKAERARDTWRRCVRAISRAENAYSDVIAELNDARLARIGALARATARE